MHAASVLGLVLATTASAHADRWIVAETPAVLAVSDAQQGIFRPGIMPAVGAYAQRGWLALGVRLRAGVLRDGPAPGDGREDPGLGGLTTAALAMRVGVRGAWLEVAGGGGVTGRDLVPSFELGAGWMFDTGRMSLGPSVRYVHVDAREGMPSLGDAQLALVGVDVRFGRPPAPPRPPRPLPAPQAIEIVARAPIEPPPATRDVDAIVEHDTSCAVELDGCRLTADLVVVGDRIVLDERVPFDLDRARVRSRGRRVVAELVAIWQAHPEWTSLVVEGHADVRGSDEYNRRLSQRRAEQVRALMIRLGADGSRIEAVGHGRARPRAAGDDEASHQRNRRVEFVIERAPREASR